MKILKITSASNPAVKEAMRLRERQSKDGAFLIEGPHLLQMALSSRCDVREIFFTESFGTKKEGRRLIRDAQAKGIRLLETDESVISKLSDAVTSQGVAAVVSMQPYVIDEIKLSNLPLIVVCDAIQDPGNIGTIIRTADAVSADAVVLLEGCCNPFNPKAVRSTAGSIFNIPVAITSCERLLQYLKSKNISLYASASEGSKLLFDADLNCASALAFGSEAHGLRPEIMASAKHSISIPIIGRAESLNVASAAAVCLYEAFRQRAID